MPDAGLTYEQLLDAAAELLRDVGYPLTAGEVVAHLEDRHGPLTMWGHPGKSLGQRMTYDPLRRFRYDRATGEWSLAKEAPDA